MKVSSSFKPYTGGVKTPTKAYKKDPEGLVGMAVSGANSSILSGLTLDEINARQIDIDNATEHNARLRVLLTTKLTKELYPNG